MFFYYYCFTIWWCLWHRKANDYGRSPALHKTWHNVQYMCLCIVPVFFFALKLDLVSFMCCLCDSDVFLVLCLVLIVSLQWWCGLREKDVRTWSICFTLLGCFMCVACWFQAEGEEWQSEGTSSVSCLLKCALECLCMSATMQLTFALLSCGYNCFVLHLFCLCLWSNLLPSYFCGIPIKLILIYCTTQAISDTFLTASIFPIYACLRKIVSF